MCINFEVIPAACKNSLFTLKTMKHYQQIRTLYKPVNTEQLLQKGFGEKKSL